MSYRSNPISHESSNFFATRTQSVSRLCFTFALGFSILCSPIAASAAPLKELAVQLENWLDTHSNLDRNNRAYSLNITADPHPLSENDAAMAIGNQTRGLYDPTTATITLVQPWDKKDRHDQSVLLHELVHHRQANLHYYCIAAQEMAAYTLQKEWLAEQGLTLDVNWIGVVLASSCTARDIHPD